MWPTGSKGGKFQKTVRHGNVTIISTLLSSSHNHNMHYCLLCQHCYSQMQHLNTCWYLLSSETWQMQFLSKNNNYKHMKYNMGYGCPIQWSATDSRYWATLYIMLKFNQRRCDRTRKNWSVSEQEVKVIWQKAPHRGPIHRLGVTPRGRKLYHWIPGVGFPISVP